MFHRRRTACAVLIAGIIIAAAWNFWPRRSDPEQAAREVLFALDRGRAADARRLADLAVTQFPAAASVRIAAAEVELEQDQVAAALVHLQQVADNGSSQFLHATGSAGDLWLRLNRLSEAERCFRRVLQGNPRNMAGWQRLAFVLAISGRRDAARGAFLEIVRSGQFDTRDLALLGEPDQVYDNPEFVKRFEGSAPDDPGALLGAARFALRQNRTAAAVEMYQTLLAHDSADLDVQAGLGGALLESGVASEFIRWHAALPAAADARADVWMIRGRFAQMRSENDVAIRCYGEAVRRDPDQIPANSQLASLLHRLGEANRARAFAQRAEQLRELKTVLEIVLIDGTRLESQLRAAELTEALGRLREARGWLLAAAKLADRDDLRDRAERLGPLLDERTPQTLATANPATSLELSRFPLPAWNALASSGAGPASSAAGNSAQVAFADRAAEAGIDFTYFNGHDPQSHGLRIFESSGGGVAALDFDGDLWPDLYFTQGCDWPPVAQQTTHLDKMFRNLGNGRFAEVTDACGLGDDRYSQGVAAGDVDNDGFVDLYVANIGANRLYKNNGDGTFSDQTAKARLASGGWSTSALIADLNGDGFPEIYDVTYLAGTLPFEHLCHDKQNKNLVRVCAPSVFMAEPDRLFLNCQDGTFEDVSSESGIAAPDGKGLGVVAFDADRSGRISLYVANDTTPNFLFLNQTARPGDRPVFQDQAKLSGCAVNADGTAPASMGIAIDDSDGDGLLDLFVTTFYTEYDVLFRQQPGGLFVDVSSQAGLKDPTRLLLGFGTQFLDGELDGWPDLVVANGHVDDLKDLGIPYRMRAQYLANRGSGQFAELPPMQLGNCFRSEHLGRGMARLDWNRDGREDLAISNLDTPASLITNQSRGAGHFIALQLRGVQSSRDAIGAEVTVEVGGRRLVKQLTAGDGFQSSNQRQLVFGLAGDATISELSVRWPAGRAQKFGQLAADAEYLMIEGRSELVRLPAPAVNEPVAVPAGGPQLSRAPD